MDAHAFSQGVAALDAGDYATAERILQVVVEQDPAAHCAWLALAVVAIRSGAPDLAVARAQRAVDLDRKNSIYLNNLGIAHAEQGDLRAAEQAFRRALKIKPDYAAAHYNLAKALHKDGKLADSLVEYERAYALDARSSAIQASLCGMYRLQGHPERALSVLRAIREEGMHPSLVGHFAEALADTEGVEAAIAWLRREHARRPGEPPHPVMAVLLLAIGQWAEGWKQYLFRTHPAPTRDVSALPMRLDGKRVLLRNEQGLGDVLFSLRFMPELLARGATIALECPDKLKPILAPRIDVDHRAAFDLEIWLLDLPGRLETDAVPPPFPLQNDGPRDILSSLGKPPYLGLTWQAGTNVLRRPEYRTELAVLHKEISPALLGSVVRGWPGTLVSLQRNPAPADLEALRKAAGAPIHDLSAVNENLPEALAILAELDEYVAVSNTNIHLIAGLGRTARVLVPHPPEWRWMREGSSPWFPGFPIYRQSAKLDWTEALARLRTDLFSPAGSRPPAAA